jgi:16S rRNA (cytosine967-C5)-methyltransferase
MVYSTCTTEPAENEEMVEWFLNTHSDFYLDNVGRFCPFPTDEPMLTLLPYRDGVDGFFIARLIRRGEAASS